MLRAIGGIPVVVSAGEKYFKANPRK